MPQTSDSSIFLQACSGQVPSTTPVWLMRQAGRILQPYRELRAKHGSIQTLFTTPELAAEVTLMPVDLLSVDAAILFTDLVTPLEAMGCPFQYAPGPVFERPVRSAADVEILRTIDPQEDLSFVLETIRLVCQALPSGIPLIGYSGSPFTLATWLVEGKSSKEFSQFRRMLYADPSLARRLLDQLTEMVILFLRAQIEAGAQAIQLFDTSIGLLSPAVFAEFVLPSVRSIFAALADCGVPRIYFPLAGPHLLPHLETVGADVLSLDWRIDLGEAFDRFSPRFALQGNMDPCLLYAPPEQIATGAEAICRAAAGKPHIFNLGHGVLPDIPSDNVKRLVDCVHERSAES